LSKIRPPCPQAGPKHMAKKVNVEAYYYQVPIVAGMYHEIFNYESDHAL